jgi:hypothetical protein
MKSVMNKKAYIAPTLEQLSLVDEQDILTTSVLIDGSDIVPEIINDPTTDPADSRFDILNVFEF